ncbi:MAG: hypothetical protein ACI9ZD_000164 [Paracoccaceae bacterium]|jgi:hypothetical protein
MGVVHEEVSLMASETDTDNNEAKGSLCPQQQTFWQDAANVRFERWPQLIDATL